MGVAGDLALALVAVALVVAAPLEVAFGTLLACWLLVPGTLAVPHLPHLLLLDRLVLWAFALRLLLRAGRPGEPPRAAYRLTPVHLAMGALLVAGLVCGVVLPAPTVSLAGDLHAWLYLLDMAVLLVVATAAIRTIGPRRVVRTLLGLVAVAVVVGLVERLTGHGWSHFFFEGLPANYLAPGAVGLGLRGSHVRSQGAAQFALEYGWVLAALLPLAVAGCMLALRRRPRRRGALAVVALPIGMAVGVVLSGSRGAEVAAAAGVLLVVVVAGAYRHLVRWWGAAVAAVAVVLVADPGFVTGPFASGAASDPSSVRLQRLPELFSLVHDPFTGLGFNGLTGTFGGVDNAYALTYATIGMVGLVALVALLLTAAATCAPALTSPRGSERRLLGTACLLGVVGLAAAAATYDLVSTLQSEWAIILLAALGAAVAGPAAPVGAPDRARLLLRAAVPAALAGVGLAVAALVPASAAQSLSVLTVAPYVSVYAPPDVYYDTYLVDTLCAAVTDPSVSTPTTSVRCDQADAFFPLSPPGEAIVTVSGPSPAAVAAETRHAFGPIYRSMYMAGGPSGPVRVGKPAWAVTAPWWMGGLGLVAVLLVPARRRRHGVDPVAGETVVARPGPDDGTEPAEPAEPAAPARQLVGAGAGLRVGV